MGTRGAYGFIRGDQKKIAYNHCDSYPSGLGQDVLDYCRERARKHGLSRLQDDFERIRVIDEEQPPTPEDIEATKAYHDLDVSRKSTSDWYCLLRNAQGDLAAHAECGRMAGGGEDFIKNSVSCEWAYVVNLNDGTLDVYKGLREKPPTAGMFAGCEDRDGTYYACERVMALSLYDLPESISERECRLAAGEVVDDDEDEERRE